MPVLATAVPRGAVPGGRIDLVGSRLPLTDEGPPIVWVGGHRAHVVAASSSHVSVIVPTACEGGPTPVRVDGVTNDGLVIDVARVVTTGVHQVDSPVCLADGTIWATQSGSRNEKSDAPLHRIAGDGTRESLTVAIANPTSLAVGPDGALFVSSRFEGTVYRVDEAGGVSVYASELGVCTGLAFGPDGALYVGDRAGTVWRVPPKGGGDGAGSLEVFAPLPSSVAAFHLAFGPDGYLYVTAPTLASRDVVYRISPDRRVDVWATGFGRPQGLTITSSGTAFVCDALAGSSGLYRMEIGDDTPKPELVVTAPQLVGVAVHPHGGLVLASSDTIWRL